MPEPQGLTFNVEQIRRDSLKRATNKMAEHFRIYGAQLELRYVGAAWDDGTTTWTGRCANARPPCAND